MYFEKKTSALFLILFFVLLTGCTPIARYQVLSFFFDGVPDPNEQILAATQDSLLHAANASGMMDITSKVAVADAFYHKPYSENKCVSCHDKNAGNRLTYPMPDLCYSCHEDLNNRYSSLHGPVASGHCSQCHDPHMAKSEKLLMRESVQLCFYCHESKQVMKNKIHETAGEKNCTECHNPHGGDNLGMLRQGSCYLCHDDFSTKFAFLHGPVAGGYCTTCHSTHMSKTKKLLSRESQQICLHCHELNHVARNAAHKDMKDKSCTECHLPHGGKDKNILVYALLPAEPKPLLNPVVPEVSDTLSIPVPPVEPMPADSLKERKDDE